MFELASRLKFRFNTSVGPLSTEDLWDLPLETTAKNGVSLDTVARDLYKQIQQTGETISFVNTTGKTVDKNYLQEKLNIVKHIIAEKLAQRTARSEELVKKARKQQIMEIIESKRAQELSQQSVEDLEKLLNDM